MALRNPYSEYSRTGDEDSVRREALLQALGEDEPPAQPPMMARPMTAQPRTPSRTPQQTREMLDGPGGRTTFAPDTDTGNAYSGDAPALPDTRVYQPQTTPAAGTQAPHTSNPSRGRQLMDDYDDAYTRRNEGPGGVWSNAAKYAQTGATVGSAFAGVGAIPGAIIGGIAGGIGGAFTKNAKTAMTDFAIDDARQIISQAHKDAFGRDITPEYLNQIVRGQGWQDGDRWMGEDSLAYVLDAFAAQAPGDRAATAAANAAATPAAGATPAGASGGLGDYARNLEGFAMERFADPAGRGNNTIKYQVGRVLSRHAPTAEGLAAAAEELRGMGIDVQQGGRIGDLLEFGAGVVDDEGNPIGPIDVGRGFGASGSGWAWQPGGASGGAGGGGEMGDAPGDVQGAYAYLKSIAHPGMSRAEMESAITRAFGNVPGFEKGYAGDVVIGGRKIDLITDFEGANPQWSDNLSFVPLHGGGSPTAAAGGGGAGGLNLASLAPGVQLAAPLGRSDINQQIQEELQRLLSGAPPRDALLRELGVL